MSKLLDLLDIQGNILRGYRSCHFARFLFFHIDSASNAEQLARVFIGDLLELGWVTPAEWGSRPKVTTNIAFTFRGLAALRLPAECLASFPPEFQRGMKKRAEALGDTGLSAPENWDEPWRSKDVHILVSCYATDPKELDEHCQTLVKLAATKKVIRELHLAQDAALLIVNGKPTRAEHFGFQDGLTNPDIEYMGDGGPGVTGNPDQQGKLTRKVRFGEFILGHRAEGDEVAPMPAPKIFARNGTFLVLRKLEQDVVGFRKFLGKQAALLKQVLDSTLPRGTNAEEFLAAKMLGRWRDGSSLDLHPIKPAGDHSNKFGYEDDPDGARCPLGAHTRRANPRASLGFGDLVGRRRLIRRGIPYGEYLPDNKTTDAADRARRGIIFQVFNASIERQFEFVQRQWINYGDAFRQGDDTDPIAGNKYNDGRTIAPNNQNRIEKFDRGRDGKGRMVIPGDERTGRPPFLCCDIPSFVTTKGGDYFFVPSLSALRVLASGRVIVS